jgi:hypothetical protein
VGLVIGIFLAVGVVTMFSLFCYFRSHVCITAPHPWIFVAPRTKQSSYA